jgi:hypothetical protein
MLEAAAYDDAVERRRMWAVVLLAAFALSVAWWASSSWTDTKPMEAPAGVKQQVPDTVKYECGAVWGAASAHGPTSTPRPLIGTPCDQRESRRRLAVLDVLIGVVGIGYLTLGRRSTHEPAPVEVPFP